MSAYVGEWITLLMMAFALGMDAFSIGLGMGMIRLRLKQFLYIGFMVGLFHVWMPLLGIMAGKFLSQKFGTFATFVGGGLLIVLGLQMIFSSFLDNDELRVTPKGVGILLFALSVSLDSFSVGLTLGIFGARTIIAIAGFGIMAMVLTWSGLLIGRNVQKWIGNYSEALGGSILFAFGIQLIWPF